MWVAVVEKHALITLAALLLVTVLAATFSLSNFSINSDLDRLIRPSKTIDWYQYDRDYRKTFPQYQQFALVVVSGESAEATFLAAESLYKAFHDSGDFDEIFSPTFEDFSVEHTLYGAPTEGVKRLSEQVLENLPDFSRLYESPSIINFLVHLETVLEESNQLEILLPEAKFQLKAFIKAIDQLKKKNRPELHLIKKFVPEDVKGLSYQFITLKKHQDFSEKLPNAITMQLINKVISNTAVDSNVQVRTTGEVALANDEISAGVDGVEIASTISLILLTIILVFGVRSPLVISGIFIMLTIGITLTTCFALLVVGSFNTLSLLFLVMFLGLGVDFAVHYSLRVVEAYQTHRDDINKPIVSAAVEAASEMGDALGLCALTSAAAFLAFLPTDYRGLAELGIVSAGGMVIAYLVTLTFFPAWFKLFGNKGLLKEKQTVSIGKLSYFLRLPPKKVLLITTVLSILAIIYIHDMRFNYSHLAMRNKDTEAMSTLLELQSRNVGTEYSISIISDAGTDILALKAALLKLPSVSRVELPDEHIPLFQENKYQYMQPVAQKLQAMGEGGKVLKVDTDDTRRIIEEFIKTMEASQDIYLDEDLQLIAELKKDLQFLLDNPEYWPLLQEAIGVGVKESLGQLKSWFSAKPFGLNELPDFIKSRVIAADGRYLINVIPANDMSNRQAMELFIDEVRSVAPNYTGRAVIEWGFGQLVMDSFKQASFFAIVLIFFLILAHFKRFSTAILVFIPLCTTTLFTFAIAKMIGLNLNMANILVVPLIYGLGVDTGIHVVHRYHHSRSLEEMMLSGTSRAVLISALTTIATFVSLSLSPHKGAASIGMLLAIAISLLLLATFIVLPALLSVFEPKKMGHKL